MDDKDNKLEIINATYNDSGKYLCTATNILGQVEKEAKLLVEGLLYYFSSFTLESLKRLRMP